MTLPSLPKTICARLMIIACVLVFINQILAETPKNENADKPAPLTTAAEILSLSGERAGERLPVSVRGIVTASESDWKGQFFVQDDTGGVFVENLQSQSPKAGDLVEVSGVSHPGAFAPIISQPHWTKIGEAPLPAAKTISIDRLMSGAEDGLRIELNATVRAARMDESGLLLDLVIAGYRLQARVHAARETSLTALIGARVRVRGTVASHYNAAVRHLTAVAIYAPSPDDFTIIEPEHTDPFAQPITPVNNVAQYHRNTDIGQRVHVRGAVTCQRLGEDIFIQDETGGVRIQTTQRETFTPGEIIEAAGFLEYENYLPLIRDAIVRPSPSATPASPRIIPAPVTVTSLRENIRHGELVTLEGKIIDRSTRPLTRIPTAATHAIPLILTTWLIQTDEATLSVDFEAPTEDPTLAAIPNGSIVSIDGVSIANIDANGKLLSTKILLPAPNDMRVLAHPSWLTPGRLRAGIAFLTLGLLILLGWQLSTSRKNKALHTLVRQLEQTQNELREAHDAARKASEQQFKAVLAERTRLARDLHDTLEQTLAGIALQLDTAAKLAARAPESSATHLQFARNWLRQSQLDLRRSIWDLRSRELEQFALSSALRRSAEHLADTTGIACDFQTHGDLGQLPEITEENILRIGQEALTNIAKHARATKVAINLENTQNTIRLRIEDNGIGFDSARVPQAIDGHFGLTGMTERAKRIAGEIQITSTPDRGTTITVEIPLVTNPSNSLPTPTPASTEPLKS